MLGDMKVAANGSVFILHACGHNPTGCDLSIEEWKDVRDIALKKNHLCFVDMAYQVLECINSVLVSSHLHLFLSGFREWWLNKRWWVREDSSWRRSELNASIILRKVNGPLRIASWNTLGSHKEQPRAGISDISALHNLTHGHLLFSRSRCSHSWTHSHNPRAFQSLAGGNQGYG